MCKPDELFLTEIGTEVAVQEAIDVMQAALKTAGRGPLTKLDRRALKMAAFPWVAHLIATSVPSDMCKIRLAKQAVKTLNKLEQKAREVAGRRKSRNCGTLPPVTVHNVRIRKQYARYVNVKGTEQSQKQAQTVKQTV